jgi:UDP-3-O-[3-hydroxymyristoyl] glucosamine N-acyltransferase
MSSEPVLLSELARSLDCRLEGSGDVRIAGVASLEHAGPGDLTFYANPRYRALLDTTRASAIIMDDSAPQIRQPTLRTAHPYFAFARALSLFYAPLPPAPGVSPLASIADNVALGVDVSIGAFVRIESGARVGDRTIVHAHSFVGAEASIGEDCLLHSLVAIRERVQIGNRVVLQNGAVIGSDGFGFTRGPDGRHHKIPQVGTVVIEDDVEIGANTTVDRATIGETRIAAGTKIDNLVQIGHSVRVGRDVLVAAQVGLAGSVTVEDRVTLGGQVGVGDHITIGEGAVAAGGSGITTSVKRGAFVTGYPAIDNLAWRKGSVLFARLPELRKQLLELAKRLDALEQRLVTERSGSPSAPMP